MTEPTNAALQQVYYAALEEARSAINSMKVEAETAGQGDEQMMLEACETISNEGLQADMAIRAALASAPRPVPSAAEAPLPLLVRDIAADLGTTPIQVCTALAQLGFGGHSVNMAVTPRMAQSLRAHFASPTPQADSQPAKVELFNPLEGGNLETELQMAAVIALRDSQPALPEITAEDRSFLHYNPNTDDIVEWVQHYASAAITADRAMRAKAASTTDSYVQPVPDKCDRIVWRGNYYHLPLTPPAQEADSVTAPASGEVAGWLPVHSNGHKFYGAPLKTEAEAKQYINQVHQSSDSVTLIARPFTWIATPPTQAANSVLEDAARYRFLSGHCRSTSEHWGGRWSIIVDGPAPKSHDSEDDFDEAVDAARKQGGAA